MKNLKFFSFLFFSFLLVTTSCKKEPINYQNEVEVATSNFQYMEAFDLTNYTPKYPEFSAQTFLNGSGTHAQYASPSVDLLRDVVDALLVQDNQYDNLNGLIHTHGFPLWDYSMVDMNDEGKYMVTVPFSKSQEVKAVLAYSFIDNGDWLRLYSKSKAIEKTQEAVTDEILNTWFLPISRLAVFEDEIFENFETELNQWIIALTELVQIDSDQVTVRCETLMFDVPWWGYEVNSEGVPISAVSGTWTFTVVDCSGGGGNPNINNSFFTNPFEVGNGSGGGVNTEASPYSNLLSLNLSSDLTDCLLNNFSEEAIIALNSLLEEEGFDVSCENTSYEDVINDIINSICSNLSTDTDNSSNENSGGQTLVNENGIEIVQINQLIDVLGENECVEGVIGNMCNSSIEISYHDGFNMSRMYGLSVEFRQNNNPTNYIIATFPDVCFTSSDLASNQVKDLVETTIDDIDAALQVQQNPTEQQIKDLFKFWLKINATQDNVIVKFGPQSCIGVEGKKGIWGLGPC